MLKQFYTRDKKPLYIPAWPLGFALKLQLLFAGGILVPLLLVIASINIYPESRLFIRANVSATAIYIYSAVYYSLFLGYLAYALRYRGNLLNDLGFTRFPVLVTIKYILAYPFVYFGIVITTVGITIAIASALGFSLSADQLAPDNQRDNFNWPFFIVATFIVPIVEEILFRGILLPAFVQKKGWVKGSIYSSLIFSLLHGPGAPLIMISSLYLSRMYYRTGSIIPGIILHMINNAFVSLIVLL